MGALFPFMTKKDLINSLIKSEENDARTLTVIAHSVRGNHVWTVRETKNKETGLVRRFIAIETLIYRRDDGWGYTSWTEDAGPCAYDCPLNFFTLAPNPATAEQGSHAIEWREKVKAATAKARRKLEVGATYAVLHCKITQAKIESVKPLRITTPGDTQVYRISKKLLGERIA